MSILGPSHKQEDPEYDNDAHISAITSNLNMNDHRITHLAFPSHFLDAVPKFYSDLNLLASGGTMTGEIDMDNNKIVNLAIPTEDTDAVNKVYVDSLRAVMQNSFIILQENIEARLQRIEQ